MNEKNTIVKRYHNNPILTPDDVPYPVATVHNAGAVKYNDRYILLFRSHKRNGRSIIGIAESADGFSFKVRPRPFIIPAQNGEFAEYEEYGVEDIRVSPVEDAFLLTYSAYARRG